MRNEIDSYEDWRIYRIFISCAVPTRASSRRILRTPCANPMGTADMAAMTDARRAEMLRLLEERRGDVLYDISHARIALGRLERELIEIEDAMQDLQNDAKGDD